MSRKIGKKCNLVIPQHKKCGKEYAQGQSEVARVANEQREVNLLVGELLGQNGGDGVGESRGQSHKHAHDSLQVMCTEK